MSRIEDEPLSPEERALADRLARLGPHDGPSPSLDAKILAAAHAAVAPPAPRRRRWPVLAAIPGGLITGAGMAAALVVVVGVVWQLRPSDPSPRPARGDGDIGYVTAEIIERPMAEVAPPPPAADAAAPVRALNAPTAKRAVVAAQRASAAAPVAAENEAPTPPTQISPSPTVATVGPDEGQRRRLDAVAVQPPAPSGHAAAAAPASASPEAAVAAQQDAARRDAFGLTQARQQQRLEEDASVAAQADAAAKASTAASPTLDRIEVTGSRVAETAPTASRASNAALANVPLDEDAKLAADAWLDRIRARRDSGDLERARESLVRFRQAHPSVRLPRDLRALAQPPASR